MSAIEFSEFAFPPQAELVRKRRRQVIAGSFFIYALLSLTLFSLFVVFFYFVIAREIEKTAVEKNISRVFEELFGDIEPLLTPAERAAIQAELEHIQPPPKSQRDRDIEFKNDQLRDQSLIIMSMALVFAVCLSLIIYLGMRMRGGVKGNDYPNYKSLLLEALLMLGFVALVETVFLGIVGANYRSIDANRIRSEIIRCIRRFIAS